jgi:hypothetical protein
MLRHNPSLHLASLEIRRPGMSRASGSAGEACIMDRQPQVENCHHRASHVSVCLCDVTMHR